jgi:hypothetical protein
VSTANPELCDDPDELDFMEEVAGESKDKVTEEPGKAIKVTMAKLLTQRYDLRIAENSPSLKPSHTDSVYHPLDRPFTSLVAILDAVTTPEPYHSFRESDLKQSDTPALVMSVSCLASFMDVMVTFVVPTVSNQPARTQVQK